MSADQGYLTAMAVAFSADAILSAILIFLWLMQRKEKHALFWGLGQLAVMGGSVVWLLGDILLPLPWRTYFCGFSLAVGMAGYWAGTKFFIGELRAIHVRRIFPAIIFAGLVFSVLWNTNNNWLVPGSAIGIGLIMSCAGRRLFAVEHRYRVLGLALMLRGGFNVFIAAAFQVEVYLAWFIGSSCLKV